MSALLSTELPGLPAPYKGKVRDVFDLGDCLLIVATDRISAFDVVMANGIPDKGRILNQMSLYWFERLGQKVPHHVISGDDRVIAERLGFDDPKLHGRCVLARKARPLGIECVARGYITGSLFKEYRTQGPNVHQYDLVHALKDGDALPRPIFTPSTKAQTGHDQNISRAEAVVIEGEETVAQAEAWTLSLYTEAAAHARKAGLILADTKFEFGHTDEGLIWIDEALSHDSSRYWDEKHYQPGVALPGFDKQYVRNFLERSDWDKTPPGPELPADVVARTRDLYLEAFRRIVGGVPHSLSGP